MKKLLLAIVVLGILASGASAVNMAGKIGLGVGWTTGYIDSYYMDRGSDSYSYSDCLCPSRAITRIGLLSRLVLEPIVEAKIVYTSNTTSETTFDMVLSPTVDFALLAHSKTNVYVKGGVSFNISSADNSVSYYGIKVGFGLEHFVSKYFAVLLSTMSGFSYQSETNYTYAVFSISNRVVNLALVWYH